MAWATAADVLSKTGETVTEAQVAQASSVITIFANRTEDMLAELKARDIYWLKEATCWQAAWQAGKAAFAKRDAVDEMQQDGLTIVHSRGGTGDHKVSLAPLAARALKNLSWKGTRSTRVKPVVGSGVIASAGHADSEAADELFPWKAL